MHKSDFQIGNNKLSSSEVQYRLRSIDNGQLSDEDRGFVIAVCGKGSFDANVANELVRLLPNLQVNPENLAEVRILRVASLALLQHPNNEARMAAPNALAGIVVSLLSLEK